MFDRVFGLLPILGLAQDREPPSCACHSSVRSSRVRAGRVRPACRSVLLSDRRRSGIHHFVSRCLQRMSWPLRPPCLGPSRALRCEPVPKIAAGLAASGYPKDSRTSSAVAQVSDCPNVRDLYVIDVNVKRSIQVRPSVTLVESASSKIDRNAAGSPSRPRATSR
jgi:hypothetical protein